MRIPMTDYPRNRFTLSFKDQTVEKQYDEYFLQKFFTQSRLSSGLGIMSYAGFSFLDYFIMRPYLLNQIIIRCIIVSPVLAVCFGLTYTRWYTHYLPVVAILAAAIGHFSMGIFSVLPATYVMGTTIIVLAFTYVFSGQRFKRAVFSGMTIVVLYECTEILVLGNTMVNILYNNFFLLSINFIGMIASHMIDRLVGQDFAKNLAIGEEKARSEQLLDQVEAQNLKIMDLLDRMRDSEKKYRAIFETTSSPTAIIEKNTVMSLVNNEFAKLVGIPKEELEGKRSWSEFIVEEDLERMKTFHLQRREGKADPPKKYELRMNDGKGRVKEIFLSIDMIPGTDKSVASLLDITERKLAERALRESEEKYRGILSSIKDGYFEMDFEGNYTFFNDSFCDFIGYSRDKFQEINYREVVSEETAKKLFSLYNMIYMTEVEEGILEYEIISKDGRKRFLESSVSIIKDIYNHKIGFRGVARDITERKEVQKALRESEEKYRSILQGIKEAYFENDLSGNISFFNDAFCDLLGYTREKLYGISYEEILPSDSAKVLFDVFNRVYQSDIKVGTIELEIIRKDNQTKYVESSIYLIKDSKGTKTGFRGFARDISERKESEKALKVAKEAAEQANRAKSRFLASMSHELRTPLNAINGIIDLLRFGSYEREHEIIIEIRKLVELLKKTVQSGAVSATGTLRELETVMSFLEKDGTLKQCFFFKLKNELPKMGLPTEDKALETLCRIGELIEVEEKDIFISYKRIKEAGDHLLGLIDTILNLAKIEAGKIEIRKSEVNIRDMVDSVITYTRSYAKAKGNENILIVYSVHESVPGKVKIDSQKVRQVLLNFLSNAVKFTPEGSVNLSVERDGGMVRFSVSDTGMGIPDSEREKIFQEFERTEGAKKIEGTGLGLTISKKLIELQGGVMGFESEFGKGSRFWFTLPV